jgi:DYW family of nucleic acid deaminases
VNVELDRISAELLQHGHKYDASWITRPIKDGETVGSILCGHSERIALAYHFAKRSNPKFIQLTKNLRVCGDCRKYPLFFLFFKIVCLFLLFR